MRYSPGIYRLRYLSSLYDDLFAAMMPSPGGNTPQFLFITGSGRNGSTLLSGILNNHPGICIPPEHPVIPQTIRYWHLHPFRSWKHKVEHVCFLLSQPSQWDIDIASIKHHLFAVPDVQRKPAYILEWIYGSFARSQGKTNAIPGDKTPANTLYIKMIKRQFPKSKIVFLLRDPRDVMASYLAADKAYYQERFDFMLWRWKNSIDKYRSLSKQFSDDVLLLKYEELVQDPQQKVDGIIQLLGLQPAPGLFNLNTNHLAFLGVKDAKHHQNLLSPISTASIGNWKDFLTKDAVRRVTKRLGTLMEEFGYPV